MLEPWALANSGWKKRLAGFFYEKAMLQGAACLQANTQKEANDFRAYGLKNRIEIVPNGVDLPELRISDCALRNKKKRLLFLGRIHPKKGLINALRAWSQIRKPQTAICNSADWQFVIAGWDQGGHENELKAICVDLGLRIANYGVAENLKLNSYKLKTLLPEAEAADVVFTGPVFGDEKDALLRSADAFILPSFSEGLPMSVLEAWSYGLPVVMTLECNLPEGFVSQAALEIRNPKMGNEKWDGLRALIEMTDQERAAMGMRGRRLVEERFTWPKVVAQMTQVYESLL
jgi:poly(glycerol-phosphate) alpha-glucosyltransferase